MSIVVSRVLHASYIFECESTRILFDPLFESPFSVNCVAYPPVEFDLSHVARERWNAVFISHYHDDHCTFESLKLIDRATPIYIYCIHDELLELLRQFGFHHVTSLILNESVEVGPFRVIPRLALDADVDSVYEIQARGLKILNVVDSWIDPSTMKRLADSAPWDLVLWPFQTMRELAALSPSRAEPADRNVPSEWLDQLTALKPRYVIPSSCQFRFDHDSWLNKIYFPITYRRFAEQVRDTVGGAGVIRLEPGSQFVLSNEGFFEAGRLPWIHGEVAAFVDYEFDEGVKAPSVREMARGLTSATEAMRTRVGEFVSRDLPDRLSRLDWSSGYFNEPREWQLSVFDAPEECHFHFRLSAGLVSSADRSGEPQWLTEIPLIKLYNAIEEGESLSSLQIRINDRTFAPSIERELADSDLLEDPLLRCLYEGAFASYQKAQLRRLSNERQEIIG